MLNKTETLLGHMLLPSPIYSRRACALLTQSTNFFINDAAAFGDFTLYMVASALRLQPILTTLSITRRYRPGDCKAQSTKATEAGG
jgi:hypothetical protein